MSSLLAALALIAVGHASTIAQTAPSAPPVAQMPDSASMPPMSDAMSGLPGTEQKLAPQNTPSADHMSGMTGMSGQTMPSMAMTGLLGDYPLSRDASGTSWQPDLAQHQGIHAMADDWMLMGHMMLWGIYDSQSGPRGGDKTFAAGILMGSARRDLANGDALQLRAMMGPDPLMGRSGYPLLLATGETANGVTPLVDRQHPHDLMMELSGTYDHRLSAGNSIFLYAADPGEPALGPTAFMHRASGMDIPDAPITHHWLDSTHITFGVLTTGFVHDDWKLEASQFTGREPDQDRYDFDPVRLDSTAVRLSFNPDEHWSLQTSWGHLDSPEQLEPAINEDRTTASATYVTRWDGDSSFAATLAWGLKQLSNGTNLNGVLLEGEYKPADPWTIFARAEWEQNNELSSTGALERAGELTLGGIHDWRLFEHWKFGAGVLYAFDDAPSALPSYDDDPHGFMAFIRLVAD